MSVDATARSSVAAVVIVLLLAAASAAARDGGGGERQAAKRHFDAGLVLLRAESFVGAAVEFEASVRAFPTRNALFNLANCYKALGRFCEALDAFERLKVEFDEGLSREMRDAVARHEEEIIGLTATLMVSADRDGATLLIDGEVAGVMPLERPLVLGPGSYQVEVLLDGHDRTRRSVTLVSRSHVTEVFELVPSLATLAVEVNVEGATLTIDGAPAGAAPFVDPIRLEPGRRVLFVEAPGHAGEERELDLVAGERTTAYFSLSRLAPRPTDRVGPMEESRPTPSALFWTGLGLTIAAGGVAGGTWIAADRSFDRFSDIDRRIAEGEAESGTQAAAALMADRQAAVDDTTLFSRLAIGFCIGASVMAAATAVVLALDLSGKEREPVAFVAAPGGAALTF